jgi:hypothetical protein
MARLDRQRSTSILFSDRCLAVKPTRCLSFCLVYLMFLSATIVILPPMSLLNLFESTGLELNQITMEMFVLRLYIGVGNVSVSRFIQFRGHERKNPLLFTIYHYLPPLSLVLYRMCNF